MTENREAETQLQQNEYETNENMQKLQEVTQSLNNTITEFYNQMEQLNESFTQNVYKVLRGNIDGLVEKI